MKKQLFIVGNLLVSTKNQEDKQKVERMAYCLESSKIKITANLLKHWVKARYKTEIEIINH